MKTSTMLIGLVALSSAVAGVPWYSGHKMDMALNTLVTDSAKGAFTIRNLRNQRDWFSSTGSLDVVWGGACASGASSKPLMMHVEYKASHGMTLRGISRFSWTAVPAGQGKDDLVRLTGGLPEVTGEGVVGYSGVVRTSVAMPAITFHTGDRLISIGASNGVIAGHGSALKVELFNDKVGFSGAGSSSEIRTIKFAYDSADTAKGIGTFVASIDSFKAESILLSNFSVNAETRANGDRLDTSVVESLKSAQVMGKTFQDMTMQAEVDGIHGPSLEALSKVSDESCGFQQMTESQQQSVRAAVKTLLATGMKLAITKVSGTGPQGGIEGNMTLDLAPASNGVISLATHLTSSGALTVRGDLVPQQQRDMFVAMGFCQAVPGGLKTGYDFGGGVLKVSGKVVNAAAPQAMLAGADRALNAYFSGQALTPQALGIVPPAAAPASVPAGN